MSTHPLANVISIADHLPKDANITQRQEAVRAVIREAAEYPPDVAPVALVSISIGPNGEARKLATMVEPEQVAALVQAMTSLAAELLEFARQHRKLAIACSWLALALVDASLWPAIADPPDIQ